MPSAGESPSGNLYDLAPQTGPAESIPSCADMSPPCPPISPEEQLEHPLDHAAEGWVFGPAVDSPPTISAAEAVALAWYTDGLPAKEATPVYATVPRDLPDGSDRPVWIVEFMGACVPIFGRMTGGARPSCAGTQLNVIVDASDGSILAAFSDGSS